MSWKKSCSFLLELAARRAEIDGQFTLALSDVHNPGAMFRFNERTVKELLRGEVDGCAVDFGMPSDERCRESVNFTSFPPESSNQPSLASPEKVPR